MVNCVTGNCLREDNKLLNNLNLQQVRYFLTVIIIIIYIDMSLKFNDDVKIKFVQLMKINTAHLKNNISNYKKCIYRLIATFFSKSILYIPSSE